MFNFLSTEHEENTQVYSEQIKTRLCLPLWAKLVLQFLLICTSGLGEAHNIHQQMIYIAINCLTIWLKQML